MGRLKGRDGLQAVRIAVEVEAGEGGKGHAPPIMIVHKTTQYAPDMRKVAATRPLVAEIFSDCGRIKAEILLSLRKLSA